MNAQTDAVILWDPRNYASTTDVIEQGFDPSATLREIVARGDVTRANLDEQTDEIWVSFVDLDRADSSVEDEDRTGSSRELCRDDLRQYLLDLIEGTR